MGEIFVARKCVNPECGLRYTLEIGEGQGKRCPVCRSETREMGKPFGQQEVPHWKAAGSGLHLEVLLDNIRSAWNVGSMLRVADGAGVRCVHLGGISPLPNQPKVTKTSLGAEESVPWYYYPDGLLACERMKSAGYRLWALEGGARAENLFSAHIAIDHPVLLVVGNEVTGVDAEILDRCERVFCLPMLGAKNSLNVAVAFAAAVYTLRFGSQAR